MSQDYFLSEEHFLDNLSFSSSDLYYDWKQFLKLFTQHYPRCPDHPDELLERSFKLSETDFFENLYCPGCSDVSKENVWVGSLRCPLGDYEEEWLWPRSVSLWDWANELQGKVQEAQLESVKLTQDSREAQVNDLVDDLLKGNKVNITKRDIPVQVWEKLGELQQVWDAWVKLETLILNRQTLNRQQIAKVRLDQYNGLLNREKLWKVWLDYLIKEEPEIQAEWSLWGKTIGWDVLEHEGIPTPRRMGELLGNGPSKMTIEVMESWFNWSNASRDYMTGMVATSDMIQKLSDEAAYESALIAEYYVNFPSRSKGVSRGQRMAIGDGEIRVEVDENDEEEEIMRGFEDTEDLMMNPEEVIDGREDEMENKEYETMENLDKERIEQERILKGMDGGDMKEEEAIEEINKLDENFTEQLEKEKNQIQH